MTDEFERLIKQLGDTLFQRVDTQLAGKPWDDAFLDVRFKNNGRSWSSKIRAHLVDGAVASVKMTNEIDLCLIAINPFRKAFGDEWFGLLFSVGADRRCEVKLNYDPQCAEDTTFYDS